VPLVSGEIAGDLTLYLTESEQTPSAMGLGVSFGSNMIDVAAAGFLVQALPGATDADLERIEENVALLPGLAGLLDQSIDAHGILDRLVEGLGSRERHSLRPEFFCPCSRERARRTLSLLDRAELRELIDSGASQEVICDFCGRDYQITSDEIARLSASEGATGS
jgi:molecular chaperone Hsp33